MPCWKVCLRKTLERGHQDQAREPHSGTVAGARGRCARSTKPPARAGERSTVNPPPVTLTINLLGREYRVGCSEDERADLLAAVEFLQERMRETRDGGKAPNAERVAVMTALNLANELLKERSSSAPAIFDSSDFRRRIVAMQTAIDHSMTGQEKLF
ncbi:MAG: cell division protein ZapA [Betaproteobacteria bacterium]|nr:cell division protein ZapA [Betaproteobacteria bacterium]